MLILLLQSAYVHIKRDFKIKRLKKCNECDLFKEMLICKLILIMSSKVIHLFDMVYDFS